MAFWERWDSIIKTRKDEQRLLSFLVWGVVVFLGVTVVRRQVRQVIVMRGELKRQESRLARLERKEKVLAATELEELEAKVRRVERIFPSEKPVVSLIATLSNLAKDKGVIFSGVDLAPGEVSTAQAKAKKRTTDPKTEKKEVAAYRGEVAPAIDFSFQIEGTKEQVFGFLEALERVAPLMKLRTLSLGFGNEGQLLAEVGVYVYYQPPPATIGKIDAPVAVLTPKEAEALAVLDEFILYPQVTAGEPSGKDNIFKF